LNANYQLNDLIGLLKEVRDAVRSPV
jgi:hypothetical protein